MNKAFVQKWVAALRSGEYPQCRTGGYSEPKYPVDNKYHSYCCIGVANVISGKMPNDYDRLNELVPELDDQNASIDTPARPTFSPAYQRSIWSHLTAMNDGEGIYKGDPRNFEQIADFIEEKLLKGTVE